MTFSKIYREGARNMARRIWFMNQPVSDRHLSGDDA